MRLANVMSGKGTEGQGVVKRGTTPYVSPVTQSFRYSPLLRDAPDVRSGKERGWRGEECRSLIHTLSYTLTLPSHRRSSPILTSFIDTTVGGRVRV